MKMKNKIKIDNIEIELKIKNITKKSLKMYFSDDKKLIIHKPKNYPMVKIMDFILKNEKNIIKEYNSQTIINNKFHFLGGLHEYSYLEDSKTLNVEIKKEDNNILVLYNKKLPEKMRKEFIEREKKKFYYDSLKELILKYINKYNKCLRININGVKIKNLKSRWGSCSSKKNLNFNVKLICFREEIIEYVVVHEMSHLIHMNHSKDFWKLVERLLPDYDARRKELKKDIKIPELLK
jgi:predicted metal-dependent hydrolase